MQLDRTQIVIRERSFLDLLDISLQVVRRHLLSLSVCVLALALPLMLLNAWLTGWMLADEYTVESRFRYLWTQGQLIFIEAPLASLLVTLYLGQTMFLQRPRWRELFGELARQMPRLLLSLFLIRGILLAWLLVGSLDPQATEVSPAEVFLPILVLYVAAVRGMRPFINEIILLERSPLFSRDATAITVGKRSTMLHNPSVGDLFARFLGAIPAAIVLTVVIGGGLWYAVGTATNDLLWGPVILHFCLPLAMWMVAGFFAVVRFLNYLDLRIRREGWETELLVRAAAAELTS